MLPSSVVIDGRPLNFLNDLDIDGDGNIYFTDSSRYQRRDTIMDMLDGRGTGRFESINVKILFHLQFCGLADFSTCWASVL